MTTPINFSYLWNDLVAGSGHPGDGGELVATLATLREKGFCAILSLTEEPLDTAPIREFGFDYRHVPIDDFTAPTLDQIVQAVDYIGEHVRRKQPTLVHCRAGIGRTGTILACFLVSHGYDPARAIGEVRRHRPGSCEVYPQEYAVHQYARYLKNDADSAEEST